MKVEIENKIEHFRQISLDKHSLTLTIGLAAGDSNRGSLAYESISFFQESSSNQSEVPKNEKKKKKTSKLELTPRPLACEPSELLIKPRMLLVSINQIKPMIILVQG